MWVYKNTRNSETYSHAAHTLYSVVFLMSRFFPLPQFILSPCVLPQKLNLQKKNTLADNGKCRSVFSGWLMRMLLNVSFSASFGYSAPTLFHISTLHSKKDTWVVPFCSAQGILNWSHTTGCAVFSSSSVLFQNVQCQDTKPERSTAVFHSSVRGDVLLTTCHNQHEQMGNGKFWRACLWP